MCLIIYKKQGETIPAHVLNNAENTNPHGFGITYLDTFETIKTLDYDLARELVESPRPLVAHYRYATVGKVGKKNCHPFAFKSEGRKFQLFANGTVGNLGSNKKTDSQEVAEMLERIPQDLWPDFLAMTEARFAIVAEDGEVFTSGAWHDYYGAQYSKSNCFAVKRSDLLYLWDEDETEGYCEQTGLDWKNDWMEELAWELPVGDLVAVYGTLKRGRGNHRVLGNAWHIGDGLTCDKYLMADHGIPYCYKDKLPGESGGRITIEVYKPRNKEQWEALDGLEGHPEHYCREMIPVEIDGEIMNAWLYFANHAPSKSETFITEF
jgi:gamma-glutamylaminecyclotransferase